MHFMPSVHYTALRGDVFAFVRRYFRPRPQISPSLLADISALARRYLRPCPQISLPVAFHDPINAANGYTPYKSEFKSLCKFCPAGF